MQVHCFGDQRGGRHHSVVGPSLLEIEFFPETFSPSHINFSEAFRHKRTDLWTVTCPLHIDVHYIFMFIIYLHSLCIYVPLLHYFINYTLFYYYYLINYTLLYYIWYTFMLLYYIFTLFPLYVASFHFIYTVSIIHCQFFIYRYIFTLLCHIYFSPFMLFYYINFPLYVALSYYFISIYIIWE